MSSKRHGARASRSSLQEQPLARRARIGERALDVPEQLALQQRLGEGRAIDRDKRPGGAATALVNGAGDQLLAGTALTGDQQRR
ncbi:MAG TPA: hypothetical protein VHT91_07345 [Kofleriaceae bacterium]|nr:hypothetical protein [Kofleriaceae bacterium]